ncbi:Tat pathway signal sequence domain protein [Streptomyces sp. NPDC005907]|uniref:Tat pathway signal sequence domain protein n=1 Tax=Streptomyces sp. NPDC005907 TaxID=3154571 RepID=UPI0033C1A68D
MSGIGPVEPGEGTRAFDAPEPNPPSPRDRSRGRIADRYARHRRPVLAAATAAALLASGGLLYATRPHKTPSPPPALPPYPSQSVDVTYLEEASAPGGVGPRSFSFAVEVRVLSGPPVTVTRMTQPYAGLSLTSAPRAPFRTTAGSSRRIVVTLHVTDCRKAPKDAGLPFLDVTLRNTRAIQAHSFILGTRYAQHLSVALQVACSNDFR